MLLQVSPAGAAGRDGRLRVGLRLLEVNQQSLLGLTHGEAVQLLRSAGDTLTVLVCDGFDTGTSPPSEVSALSTGCGVITSWPRVAPDGRSFGPEPGTLSRWDSEWGAVGYGPRQATCL